MSIPRFEIVIKKNERKRIRGILIEWYKLSDRIKMYEDLEIQKKDTLNRIRAYITTPNCISSSPALQLTEKLNGMYLKLEEEIVQIENKASQYRSTLQAIESGIRKLDVRHQDIMRHHFVQRERWKDLCAYFNLSKTRIYNIINQSLDSLSGLL